MTTKQRVIWRGVRLGAGIGAWPAGIVGTGCLVVAFVFLVGELLHGGLWGTVRTLTSMGVLAVVGSMAVGLLVGAVSGLVLAVAPRRLLTRAPLRGLLAGFGAAAPLALLVAALLGLDVFSLAEYPSWAHTLMWSVPLVVALVAAGYSGDVAGSGPHPCGADGND